MDFPRSRRARLPGIARAVSFSKYETPRSISSRGAPPIKIPLPAGARLQSKNKSKNIFFQNLIFVLLINLQLCRVRNTYQT